MIGRSDALVGVDLGVGAGNGVFDGGFLVYPFPVGVVEFVQVGDPCGCLVKVGDASEFQG